MFLLALIDSAGIPLPAGVDALVIALAAVKPTLAVTSATLATVGSTIGCLILFYLARKGGERYFHARMQSGNTARLREWFQRYGLATVFVTALSPIPMPTKAFILLAGALGAKPLAFLLVIVAARAPRYFGLAYLGTQFGPQSGAWLRAHVWHLAGILTALLVLIFLVIRLKSVRPR